MKHFITMISILLVSSLSAAHEMKYRCTLEGQEASEGKALLVFNEPFFGEDYLEFFPNGMNGKSLELYTQRLGKSTEPSLQNFYLYNSKLLGNVLHGGYSEVYFEDSLFAGKDSGKIIYKLFSGSLFEPGFRESSFTYDCVLEQ